MDSISWSDIKETKYFHVKTKKEAPKDFSREKNIVECRAF